MFAKDVGKRVPWYTVVRMEIKITAETGPFPNIKNELSHNPGVSLLQETPMIQCALASQATVGIQKQPRVF